MSISSRLLSLLILGFGAIHPAMSAGLEDNCHRKHYEPHGADVNDGEIVIPVADDDLLSLDVEVRALMHGVKQKRGMADSWWGVTMRAPGDTVKVSLRFGNTDFGDILDRRIAELTVERNGCVVSTREVDGFVTDGKAFNSLALSLAGDMLEIKGGGHRNNPLAEIRLPEYSAPAEVSVWSVGRLTVPVFTVETCRNPATMLDSGMSLESLRARIDGSHDPLEGFWTYFDRNNDPKYARMGGRYTLGIVKREPDNGAEAPGDSACYDIIYVSGAQTYGDRWKPMMVKGVLRPTIFEGHYDMEWIDATFSPITEDINAVVESDGALLTLNFPMLRTTMRFSKIVSRH